MLLCRRIECHRPGAPHPDCSQTTRAQRAKPKSRSDDMEVARGNPESLRGLGFGLKMIFSFFPSGLARQRRAFQGAGAANQTLEPTAADSCVIGWLFRFGKLLFFGGRSIAETPVGVGLFSRHRRGGMALRPLRGRYGVFDGVPGVSPRSTPGYPISINLIIDFPQRRP